jgi:Cu/Ag efflux pump CusA
MPSASDCPHQSSRLGLLSSRLRFPVLTVEGHRGSVVGTKEVRMSKDHPQIANELYQGLAALREGLPSGVEALRAFDQFERE